MADNPTVDNGALTDYTVAADDVGSGVLEQYIKLSVGADNASAHLVDQAVPTVLLPVSGGVVKRISVTPTISTGIYAAKDALGGLLTFSNAARASGGSIIIDAATLIDKDQEMVVTDLILFDQTFTASTDNNIFAPSDADLANVIGAIQFNTYQDFSTNAISSRSGLGLACKLNGTDLYGQLVTRATPTYTATSDIVVILHIRQL